MPSSVTKRRILTWRTAPSVVSALICFYENFNSELQHWSDFSALRIVSRSEVHIWFALVRLTRSHISRLCYALTWVSVTFYGLNRLTPTWRDVKLRTCNFHQQGYQPVLTKIKSLKTASSILCAYFLFATNLLTRFSVIRVRYVMLNAVNSTPMGIISLTCPLFKLGLLSILQIQESVLEQ